jgi:hypothetical protein
LLVAATGDVVVQLMGLSGIGMRQQARVTRMVTQR